MAIVYFASMYTSTRSIPFNMPCIHVCKLSTVLRHDVMTMIILQQPSHLTDPF
jgi:hypothetical protein